MSQVPLTTDEEFKAAVAAAKKAFPSWRNTPITKRQRVMLKFQELIHRDLVSILQCYITLATLDLLIDYEVLLIKFMVLLLMKNLLNVYGMDKLNERACHKTEMRKLI